MRRSLVFRLSRLGLSVLSLNGNRAVDRGARLSFTCLMTHLALERDKMHPLGIVTALQRNS